MLFLCRFPLGPGKQLLESAISILSYVSASCKAGRFHETLVPTAESQLRVLVNTACLICLNAKSFSLETQSSLFPISLLSYLLNPPEHLKSKPTSLEITHLGPPVYKLLNCALVKILSMLHHHGV